MMLDEKIAIVTGATRGLGFAIADLFRKEGATVICVDKDIPKEHEKSFSFFNAYDNDIHFKQVDITDSNAVKDFAEYIKEKFGRVDILINNAGVHITGNIEEISEENFKKSMDVNVLGTFYVTKYIIPFMKNHAEGAVIVNVSSNLGIMGAKGRVAYPTTKAAIANFTRCMAMDYAEHNIRVNAVAPGAITTELTLNFFKERGKQFVEENRAQHTLNRFAEPKEIAQSVLFLASDMSSYCTGSLLSADGGYTCGK
jgi:NAD(P)-dependent dehydrogenase (short-subunit alcohol dehydrogenase family)